MFEEIIQATVAINRAIGIDKVTYNNQGQSVIEFKENCGLAIKWSCNQTVSKANAVP